MRPVLLVLAGFALVALLLAWTRWLAGRRWAATGNLALGLLAAGVAALGWPLVVHLETYERHRSGQSIAELFLEQTASQRFRATLTRLPSGRMQVFELAGDQWRLEARTLLWIGRAAELGLAPSVRLEQLRSRRSTGGVEEAEDGSAFQLSESRGLDLWAWAQGGSPVSRVVEARRRESPWRPMANGARFVLRLAPAGLEAGALNAAATESLAAAR